MKRKILSQNARIGILNRGEAAVRFTNAVKEFNIEFDSGFQTIAFYQDAEAEALFVKGADIGHALSSFPGFENIKGSPYLDGQFMVDALKASGASAVWVGWGFLAEDPVFAELLEKNDILLLGPSSASMKLLGDKIQAKELADRTKVPTIPWSKTALRDEDHAAEMAEKIGYPVILKSAFGGGGRGIRKVYDPSEIKSAFQTTSDEIERFFGDRTLFMEALVVTGRHLEVQCVADYFRNVQTFNVRDCSVQRNNQKIFEETPPPNLTQEIIDGLEEGSKKLLVAAEYEGAATVEYLYDLDRKQAFFMEVNTRLQVEHPITEELFLIDLVRYQIQVAMGEKICTKPKTPFGHVMELRLNAEDPDNKFMPTPGKILKYHIPNLPGVRIDSGVEFGSSISPDFDSMIAKLIAHGSNRANSMAKLKRALRDLKIEIENGTTNQGFALEILSDPAFMEGGVATSYVEEFLKSSDHALKKNWDIAAVAAAIYQYEQQYNIGFQNVTAKLTRHSIPRNIPELGGQFPIQIGGNKYVFGVRSLGRNYYHIDIDGKSLFVQYFNWGRDTILKTHLGKHKIQLTSRNKSLQCEVDGLPYLIELDDGGSVSAPSPSVVLGTEAKVGDQVEPGQLLLTLEAMKMEIAITAKEAGVVKEVLVKPGEKVEAGQALVEIEPNADQKDDGGKKALPPIDFKGLQLDETFQDKTAITQHWDFLTREYLATFLGFDPERPVHKVLGALENFVEQQPQFHKKFINLILRGCEAFITIQGLIKQTSEEQKHKTNPLELITHYFLRAEDREKGLPKEFIDGLNKALGLYTFAEAEGDIKRAKAIFHIIKATANTKDSVELLKHSLFALKQHYPQGPAAYPLQDLAKVLSTLTEVGIKHRDLVDAAVHSRYELVDKIHNEDIKHQQQLTVIELLHSVINEPKQELKKTLEIIESGHQIVTYLTSLDNLDPEKHQKRLEIIGRRFNRDRRFVQEVNVDAEHQVYCIEAHSKLSKYFNLTTMLSEDAFFKPLGWLESALDQLPNDQRECTILIKCSNDTSHQQVLDHMGKNALSVSLCTVGIIKDQKIVYYSFAPEKGVWQESVRRRTFSPLRYRELKLSRLEHFDLQLLYHSRFVHVVKLTAYDNPRDQRLFAFVEVPEANFEVVDSRVQSIKSFQYNIYEAAQAIREQQSRHNRRFYWNRIVVHIGQTHPVKLNQIGKYPDTLMHLVRGIGLEKIVIYTKISGRRRRAIDAEVLIENFATKHTIRGRLPSKEKLKPLSTYDAKLIRAARSSNPYPYQVVNMLTDQEHFPGGRFQEFDIEKTDAGYQRIEVVNRPFGENSSNIVFGIISNEGPGGVVYDRVLLLGDPSNDLGALTESECIRVMQAIDLAEERQIPVEWIPVSSGAAIGMESGTENLDWTASALRRIIEFTQNGGEVNIIVDGINVGAQSYWNAEATMLMHTKGILIMTQKGSMVLTGKKALDFSGSVSGDDNVDIGGAEKIMEPNGQAQIMVNDFEEAYAYLFMHYRFTYTSPNHPNVQCPTEDPVDRNVCVTPYQDDMNHGFSNIGDILGPSNKERKKPFDLRQIMGAVKDQDAPYLERWQHLKAGETAVIWETQLGGTGVGLIGIESQPIVRLGEIPNDGPDSWNGGTLYPLSSKKVARAINSFSDKVPLVVLANISGFDGSPESLRKLQLEYGAEIGRAVVNFKGPIVFVVLARYHGGAYVVFSKSLNPNMKVLALEHTFASVIGGAPAAAVVFPRQVRKEAAADPRMVQATKDFKDGKISQQEFSEVKKAVNLEKQAEIAQRFEQIHSIARAKSVGSLDEIIKAEELRPAIVRCLREFETSV